MLEDKINTWIFEENTGADIQKKHELVSYLAENVFKYYEPEVGPKPNFLQRVVPWLENCSSEEDQKILYSLLSKIFFIGREEFDALYRVFFNHLLKNWLVKYNKTDLLDSNLNETINNLIDKTWFCPISDSMRINSFYHVNNVSGFDHRPDWRSLTVFGNPQKVISYANTHEIKNIVLLEDFVGTGSQLGETFEFLKVILNEDLNVILAPLVVCPNGNQRLLDHANRYDNLHYLPSLILSDSSFIKGVKQEGEDNDNDEIRALIKKTYPQVCGGEALYDPDKPYGPFGFGGVNALGALVVMYSNCPDNTLPIVYYGSEKWKPLFPRASRL